MNPTKNEKEEILFDDKISHFFLINSEFDPKRLSTIQIERPYRSQN